MFREEKNLKDPQKDSIKDTKNMPAPYEAEGFRSGSVTLSYTKTNKLITALYMVTDVIEKDEPLRHKLRTLGTGIISDMHSTPSDVCFKVSEIMSFLDIAFAMNIISEMNCNILRKEFLELDESIKASTDNVKKQTNNKKINLSEFLKEESTDQGHYENEVERIAPSSRPHIGHRTSTSIGVQKGSTLMKALSGVASARPIGGSDKKLNHANGDSFDVLKKQRRDEISNLIQKNGRSATITDIKSGAYGSLASCSEKTLQRELLSMVKDGVLNKTGEKRWSKYFLK